MNNELYTALYVLWPKGHNFSLKNSLFEVYFGEWKNFLKIVPSFIVPWITWNVKSSNKDLYLMKQD